jgi:hypothetical protein
MGHNFIRPLDIFVFARIPPDNRPGKDDMRLMTDCCSWESGVPFGLVVRCRLEDSIGKVRVCMSCALTVTVSPRQSASNI